MKVSNTRPSPTDDPYYPEQFCSPTIKPQQQLATQTIATGNPHRRHQIEDFTVTRPADSTSFAQEPLLNSLLTTIEKIGISHDFPAIQVIKFDGSPQNFPVFRQRFKQMVLSKPLDESTKMSRLLQLLEGAPLNAVRRYETLPDGLNQAMKLLEDRFGKPCQIVRACVDALMKGPTIARFAKIR
jgi:hypothetical protein